MHRLTPVLLALLLGACAPKAPVVRDTLAVEQHRARITKVRHAIEETRGVIAASQGAPYLPELYMRLAELTSDEARYHYLVAYEREQGRAEALHLPQVVILKEQAIGTYQLLLARYPESHLADRVLYNMSQEQRELGEYEDMASTLRRLVEEHPDSPYRTEALLVLGDFHNDKREFRPALRYYKQIVGAHDRLEGMALYKLGWVHLNLGDCEQSLRHFEKALDVEALVAPEDAGPQVSEPARQAFAIPKGRTGPGTATDYRALDVRREALVDLTYCYAQVRPPEEAAAYLRDRAASREAYVAALDKMANRFALIEQPKGAAEVSRELLRLAPDAPERLDDARMLHRVVTRMNDYTQVGEDVGLIIRAMRRQSTRPGLEEDARTVLHEEFELISRDLATKAHRALQGEVRSEYAEEPADLDETVTAYQAWMATFPEAPQRGELMLNLGDLLRDGEHFLEAGHRYREAAVLLDALADEEVGPWDGTAEEASEDGAAEAAEAAKPAGAAEEEPFDPAVERISALYEAAVSYQRALEQATTHRERALSRAGLRAAGAAWLAEAAEPDPERARRLAFSMGRSYYDEGDYTRAIDQLTAVAYAWPGTEQGDAAAHMVLDSYNTTHDISGLIAVGRRFSAPESPLSLALKTEISPIVASAEQRRLDDLSLAASGDQAGGMEVLLAFADRYEDSDLGERALLATFVAARAGGDTERLYEVGQQLLERYPDSEQVAGVASTLGQVAASRFEFERSLSYLDQAAGLSKVPGQQAALLLTSGEVRERLADTTGARQAYLRAMNLAPDPATRAEAVAHIADLIERTRDPAGIIRELEPLSQPFDAEIAARLGLALLREGRIDEAEVMLLPVVDAVSASPGARARANYGMAEIMLFYLEEFEPMAALESIDELNAMVEITVQSYLAAARQPEATYSQAALSRLARATWVGAEGLETMPLPSDLTADQAAALREALAVRAATLRDGGDEALVQCAQRARSMHRLDGAGVACIKGEPPARDPITSTRPAARRAVGDLPGLADARTRLSRNPDDLEALRAVGRAFLDAGDPHTARLALGRIAEAGGGAEDLELLGRACHEAGDALGALEAWGKAAAAGSARATNHLDQAYAAQGVSRE